MKKKLTALLVLVLLLVSMLPVMAFAEETQEPPTTEPAPVVTDVAAAPPTVQSGTPATTSDTTTTADTTTPPPTETNPGTPTTGTTDPTEPTPGDTPEPSPTGAPAPTNTPAPTNSPTPAPTSTPCAHAKATYINNGNSTHHRYCKDCGTHFKSESCVYTALPDDRGGAGHIKICGVCGGNVFEKHSDNNNNGKCDICGHDMNDLTTTDTSTGIDRAYTTGDSAAVLATALLLVICVSAISLKKKHSV